MSAGGKVHCCCHLTFLAILLVVAPKSIAHAGFVHRRLLQSPAPYAFIGPEQVSPGFSVEAVLDLWGVGLLPFGLDMQQTLLNVLNATVTEAGRDELQLLAVEELLPLSGPSSVTISSNRASNNASSRNAQAPASGPAPAPAAGRRLLLQGLMRRLLQVLAQAGNPDNLVNLPHLEVKVRIATSPGLEDTVVRETINAVNGPVLPMLNEQGVNVSYIQLTDTGLSYGNGTSAPVREAPVGPPRPPVSGELSATAIGLIVAAAVVVVVTAFAAAMFVRWRRRKARGELPAQGQKALSNGSHTSVQADSVLATSPSPSLGAHQGLMLRAGCVTASLSHSNSLVSSQSSQQSSKPTEGEAAQVARIAGLDTAGYSVPFSELQFSRVIGEGSYGRVYLGKWREITVAIKILNSPGGPLPDDSWDLHDLTQLKDASWSERQQGPSFSQQMLIQELAKEAALMAGLRHPNIVMFLGISTEPPCMVTEFCARGSLLDVLHRARTNKAVAMELDWWRRLRLLLDAAKGMFYLHSRQPPVLHRDLKSANLLVDKHWQVKVADFNLSRVMQPSAAVSSLAATNPRWLPPEVLSGNGYGAAADVYAFGVIMWELLTWQVPWEGETPWQVVISVVDRDQRPTLPPPESLPGGVPAAGSQYLKVMRQCWATKAEDRPTYAKVINDVRSLIDVEDLAAMERLNAASDNGSVMLPATGDSSLAS